MVHRLLGFGRHSYLFIASSNVTFFCSIAHCSSFFSIYFGSPSSSGYRWPCHSLRPSATLNPYTCPYHFSIIFPVYPKLFVPSIFSLISSFLIFWSSFQLFPRNPLKILKKKRVHIDLNCVVLEHSWLWQHIYRLISGTTIWLIKSQHSSVGIVTRLWATQSWLDYWLGLGGGFSALWSIQANRMVTQPPFSVDSARFFPP